MRFKLAVSNIAWAQHDNPAVLGLLGKHGVTGIEVAPTKIWPDWEGATTANAEAYRRRLHDAGLVVPALQAILFGKPELGVFLPETHRAFLSHLDFVSDIGHALGARVLVFGAPKNRRKGDLSNDEAQRRAGDFLRAAGDLCMKHDCILGVEPNPPAYGCDFVNTVAEARALVRAIDSPGVKLHLDSGATRMNGESLEFEILNSSFVHYHISEPNLVRIGTGGVDHRAAFHALASRSYPNWVSIEMRQAEPELETLDAALRMVVESMA